MKDEIFSEGSSGKGSFRFNQQVANVFDDMANRSIPYYQDVIQIIGQLANSFVADGGLICDLGCSTGSTLIFLAKVLQGKNIRLVGCDPAAAMLVKAREKSERFTYSHNIFFEQNSCEDMDLEQADMILLNYTLQFIEEKQRPALLKKLYKGLKPGGVLILSEKLRQQNSIVEDFNTKSYESFKAGNGYSFLEIANKRQALENILVPGSLEDNLNMLSKAGFEESEILFKWLNFATFAAFKKE